MIVQLLVMFMVHFASWFTFNWFMELLGLEHMKRLTPFVASLVVMTMIALDIV